MNPGQILSTIKFDKKEYIKFPFKVGFYFVGNTIIVKCHGFKDGSIKDLNFNSLTETEVREYINNNFGSNYEIKYLCCYSHYLSLNTIIDFEGKVDVVKVDNNTIKIVTYGL